MPPDYGPDPIPPLLSLLAQVAGLVAGGVAIAALMRRPGRPLGPARAVVVAAAVVLLTLFAASLWDGLRSLDRLHADREDLPALAAREWCALETGVDPNFLQWLSGRIPDGERYYIVLTPEFARQNRAPCASMLLLPRQRVGRPHEARWLVLSGEARLWVRLEMARPGAVVETFTPNNVLIRKP